MGLDIYFHKSKYKLDSDGDYATPDEFNKAVNDGMVPSIDTSIVTNDLIQTYIEKTGIIDSTVEDIAKWYRDDRLMPPLEEIGYFRKVNFLVQYFEYEEYVDNSQFLRIDPEIFPFLKEDCEDILQQFMNETGIIYYEDVDQMYEKFDEIGSTFVPSSNLVELSDTLLPTLGGFFFGNTEYNIYYFYQVWQVYRWIDDLEEEGEFDPDYYYYMMCWW